MRTFKKHQVIDLLTSFIEYKEHNIPFLNSYIGETRELEVVSQYFNEYDETYEIEVSLKFSNVDQKWIENDFELLVQMADKRDFNLDYTVNKMRVDVNLIVDYESLSWDESLLCFKGKLVVDDSSVISQLRDSELFKRDTNQMFRIGFLSKIIKSIEEGKIISDEAQNIILNISKISRYIRGEYEGLAQTNLDTFQKEAFKVAIGPNDISIIKGPPGTGKSRLITALVRYYAFEKKQKVILASQTHAALDNVIEKTSLTPDGIGSYSGVGFKKSSKGDENKIYSRQAYMLKTNIRERIADEAPKGGELEKLLSSTHDKTKSLNRFIPGKAKLPVTLFFSTLASASLDLHVETSKTFKNSILIIDEVSRLSIVDVLRFASYATKVILVGDNKQLPPMDDNDEHVHSFKASLSEEQLELYNHLFKDSIFEKLFDESFKDAQILKNCYRSHEGIVSLYNKVAYEGEIRAKGHKGYYEFKDGLVETPFSNIFKKDDTFFINHTNASIGASNPQEVKIVQKIIDSLTSVANMKDKELMVIFSFKNDYYQFKKDNEKFLLKMKRNFKHIKLGTVDKLQGQEADIVIYATGKNEDRSRNTGTFKYTNILQNLQRVNVALSRSRDKLFIIGNKDYMASLLLWDAENQTKTKYTWNDVLKNIGATYEVENE